MPWGQIGRWPNPSPLFRPSGSRTPALYSAFFPAALTLARHAFSRFDIAARAAGLRRPLGCDVVTPICHPAGL